MPAAAARQRRPRSRDPDPQPAMPSSLPVYPQARTRQRRDQAACAEASRQGCRSHADRLPRWERPRAATQRSRVVVGTGMPLPDTRVAPTDFSSSCAPGANREKNL